MIEEGAILRKRLSIVKEENGRNSNTGFIGFGDFTRTTMERLKNPERRFTIKNIRNFKGPSRTSHLGICLSE